jgi:hypothetical protein
MVHTIRQVISARELLHSSRYRSALRRGKVVSWVKVFGCGLKIRGCGFAVVVKGQAVGAKTNLGLTVDDRSHINLYAVFG